MKLYVTGSTKGLGAFLVRYFGGEAIDRPIVDLNTDIDNVVNKIEEGSTVILNAHANQLEYVQRLKDKCSLIIMGSIAAVNADPNMLEYSKEKTELEIAVRQLSLHSKYPMLYLQLTSSSYKDRSLIADSIEFWIDHPQVTSIGYNIND